MFYSIQDLADITGKSQSQVRDILNIGGIMQHSHKVKGDLHYFHESVLKLIREAYMDNVEYTLSNGAKVSISWSTLTEVPFDNIANRLEDILKLFPSYNGEKVVEVKCFA